MTDFLTTNLALLAERQPAWAEAIAAAPALADAELLTTRSGTPSLAVAGHLLHNRHDPQAEASQWANTAIDRLQGEEAQTAVVIGFGLGHHVEVLAARWAGPIVVVEPDAALWRVALGTRDLRALLVRIELAPSDPSDAVIDAWTQPLVLRHQPSLLRPGARLRALDERVSGRVGTRGLRLKILVVSPLNGGSYPITGYCARALAELGHDVHVLDMAPFSAAAEALPAFSSKMQHKRAVGAQFNRFLGAGVMARVDALKPDLVLAMAQAPLDRAVLDEIGSHGSVRAMWFVEDHRLFPYWREVIGGYDYFAVIQQGPFLAEAQTMCPGAALYLPMAADPTVHRPLDLTLQEHAEFGAPVSFMGAGYRNRRLAFRPLLDLGLKIWGSDWAGSGHMLAALQRRGQRIDTDDSVRIFNASTINLNLHSSTYVDGVEPQGDFVNPRTFELAACGAFQLVDHRGLLPALFEPGREVVTFDDASALRGLVQHWLDRPAERRRVVDAARARVLAEHTYTHRMRALIELICGREQERFRRRERTVTAATVAAREPDGELGRYLRQLPPHTPFTLEGLVAPTQEREGALSDAEGILLFLHQFDELYVKEHRA